MKRSQKTEEAGARFYELPDFFEEMISRELSQIRSGLGLEQTDEIARAIQKLNQFYIDHPQTETPWSEAWCQVAYLAYYFPLNYVRTRAVLDQIRPQTFFHGVRSVVDFASGPGTSLVALDDFLQQMQLSPPSYAAFESSSVARRLAQNISRRRGSVFHQLPSCPENVNLFLCSYGLTEIASSPQTLFTAKKIILIEPATYIRSQALVQLREKLREAKYFFWAPCPHQEDCPLRGDARDWCHDRIHFQAPDWFERLEKKLQIKNQTLTFSYLVAAQEAVPRNSDLVRTVGDPQVEKGRIRSLICRSSQKETLSWLTREITQPPIARGALFQMTAETEKKSQGEVRVKTLLPLVRLE